MSSDNQFTAIGAAEIGFQTNSASIRIGADIAGNELGVKGSCTNGPGIVGESTTSEAVKGTSVANIGVSGTGTPGVFGHGREISATGHNGVMGVVEGAGGAGIFGGHRKLNAQQLLDVTSFDPAGPPGAGVFGVSTDEGNGVVGQGRFGHGVLGTSKGGVEFKSHGVFGRSDQTAGVVGISGPDGSEQKSQFPSGRAGVFGFSIQGTGVFGSTNEKSSHGVRGSSVNGDGVLGTSKHGRGGVFASGEREGAPLVPQLQLTPQLMSVPGIMPANPQMFTPKAVSALPKAGQGGDLLVTQDKNHLCTLWFCVQGQDGTNPALWSQVLLGEQPIKGGG